jgi:hypothetical protein
MDTAMTASAYQDPIASMVTMPHRVFVPPTPFGHQWAPSIGSAHPAAAQPLIWPTQPRHFATAMPVRAAASDRQVQRLALGLLLTVLLPGIPLAACLASMA